MNILSHLGDFDLLLKSRFIENLSKQENENFELKNDVLFCHLLFLT